MRTKPDRKALAIRAKLRSIIQDNVRKALTDLPTIVTAERKTGVSKDHIYAIVEGRKLLSLPTAYKLAEGLGVSIRKIIPREIE